MKQVFLFVFLPPISHTQFCFSSLPSVSFLQPIKKKKKHAVHLLDATQKKQHKTTPPCHLSCCRSLFGFKFPPPSVLQFSLSSPSSLPLCFLPSSIRVYFWLQKTSAGRRRKSETKAETDQTERWLWLKGEVVNLDFLFKSSINTLLPPLLPPLRPPVTGCFGRQSAITLPWPLPGAVARLH